ncbi:hypothetical protein ABTB66_18030 [Acinetobacter baumannii]
MAVSLGGVMQMRECRRVVVAWVSCGCCAGAVRNPRQSAAHPS